MTRREVTYLNIDNSILKEVREGVGIGEDTTAFDKELLMFINAGIGTLNQNGVGLPLIIDSVDATWGDLMDPLQLQGNFSFGLVPLYLTLNTKIIFDPPPPSIVETHSTMVHQLLWRLKVAYETPDKEVRYDGERR